MYSVDLQMDCEHLQRKQSISQCLKKCFVMISIDVYRQNARNIDAPNFKPIIILKEWGLTQLTMLVAITWYLSIISNCISEY
jgi:hypothetical protein